MTQTVLINGLDVAKSRDTKERIRADGDGPIAKPRYESVIHWNTGYKTTASVSSGRQVFGDEPEAYGGASSAPTPQDLLLTAIGNCLAATYVGGLSAAGITIHSLRISVSGKVNFRVAYGVESGAPGFESIEAKVDIDTDHPHDKVKALLQKLLPTAPIPDTILRPVPLTVRLETLAA